LLVPANEPTIVGSACAPIISVPPETVSPSVRTLCVISVPLAPDLVSSEPLPPTMPAESASELATVLIVAGACSVTAPANVLLPEMF
jgi:hypothetical protein